MSGKASVILFKPSGKYYTEEEWAIPEGAIGPYDMERSPDFRRIAGGPVLVETQEPWGYPQLFPGELPTNETLAALSAWIDGHNAHRDPEALLWGRISKIAEEHGEVVQALISAHGWNPRKPMTVSLGPVIDELLDVAVTALAAVEHMTGNKGDSMGMLERKIDYVARRAGVIV